jgi:hypothetical protein
MRTDDIAAASRSAHALKHGHNTSPAAALCCSRGSRSRHLLSPLLDEPQQHRSGRPARAGALVTPAAAAAAAARAVAWRAGRRRRAVRAGRHQRRRRRLQRLLLQVRMGVVEFK